MISLPPKSIADTIKENVDHDNFIDGANGYKLKYGDYVISGLVAGSPSPAIGYVTQVREQWGAFGSDLFFIRETNGSLSAHENQCFWKLTEEQIDLVKDLFPWTPEDELKDNPELEYSQMGQHKHKGFFIPVEDSPEEKTAHVTWSVTVSKDSI